MEFVESPHPAVAFLFALSQHQDLVFGSWGVQLTGGDLQKDRYTYNTITLLESDEATIQNCLLSRESLTNFNI